MLVLVIVLGAEKTDHEHDYEHEHEGEAFVRSLLLIRTPHHFPFLARRDLRDDFALAAVALEAGAALCRRTMRSITATRVSSSSSKPL